MWKVGWQERLLYTFSISEVYAVVGRNLLNVVEFVDESYCRNKMNL